MASNPDARKSLPEKTARGTWVQTERALHEEWGKLIRRSPLGAQIMHFLAARIGHNNAVVISLANLARLTNGSKKGVLNAVRLLEREQWIEIRTIGATGSTNAYVLNDRVAWAGKRDGLKYSLFSATVVVSSDEQRDREDIEHEQPQGALKSLPSIYGGEQQLPSGDGLPPPSQPSITGLEPDLPARQLDIEDDVD